MIPAHYKLDGKVALVVGDGRGWTGKLATSLLEAGASVAVVTDTKYSSAQITAGLLNAEQRLLTVTANLNSTPEIEKTVAKVNSWQGQIDILVNNFDFWYAQPLLDMTDDDWEFVIHNNLTRIFKWTKAAGRYMLARKQGSIINIGSILAERGLPNAAAYCAGCGGVSQFTKSLALEWASQNVRINTIGVGWAVEAAGEDDKAQKSLERFTPAGRFCKPEDIAAMLVYLASPAGGYVTGQTYYVSGGVMAHG